MELLQHDASVDILIGAEGPIASFRSAVAKLKHEGIDGPLQVLVNMDTWAEIESQCVMIQKIIQPPGTQLGPSTLGGWEVKIDPYLADGIIRLVK